MGLAVDPAPLTPEQAKRLAARMDARLVERMRRTAPWGALVAAGVAIACWFVYPELPVWKRIGPPVLIGLGAVGMPWFSRIPFVIRRFGFHSIALATVFVALQALHVAWTGGFASPLMPTPFILWAIGAVAAPIGARIMIPGYALHLGVFVGIQYAVLDHPGSPLLFVVIAISIAIFSILGSFMRDQAEQQLFVVNDRLDALNESLEQRVRAQVQEIVARAREVESLNAELRAKVQERSRELAQALRRLSERSQDERDLRAGDEVGDRVRIVRLLGRGGMGAVYLGDDRVTGGKVAVKLMHPRIAMDPTALQRFLAEATAASAIAHPGIVKTLHVDVAADGRLYQIMEYVDGSTLGRMLDRGATPAPQVARIGAEIARALAAAHRAGVIHRDIKPQNLVLCPVAPGVRILDFGLSKVVEREREQSATGLTHTHQLMGTPAYMSPEQVRDAARVTAATDIYSLGAVLYEMIAGRRLFPVEGPALFVAHLADQPVPLECASPALAELVHRCLAKSPEERPSANDLVFHLTHIADELRAPSAESIGSGFGFDSTLAQSA